MRDTVTEIDHHDDAINQPSIVATSSIKHTMSAKEYLISAHVSAQQHYRQQSVHKQGTKRELLSSATGIASHSATRSSYSTIYKEVQYLSISSIYYPKLIL